MSMALLFYTVASVLVTALCFLMAYKIFQRKDRNTKLGAAMIFSGLANANYLVSVFVGSYFWMSYFSSLYFWSVNLALLCFLGFTISYCRVENIPSISKTLTVFTILVMLDGLCEMINPFREITLCYTYSETSLQHWRYSPLLLYQIHLFISYSMVAAILLTLTRKALQVPPSARLRYTGNMVSLLVIVGLNALYLYLPDNDLLDYSLFLYPLMGILVYFNIYYFTQRQLKDRAMVVILGEIPNPVFLFDHESRFTASNSAGDSWIPNVKKNDEYQLDHFLQDLNIQQLTNLDEDLTFRFIKDNVDGSKSYYTCAYQIIRDKGGAVSARMFFFTDNTIETDPLTGFRSQSSFFRDCTMLEKGLVHPAGMAALDLNQLGNLNRQANREVGNQAIQTLARIMTDCFPEKTLFFRMSDANLMAICPDTDASSIHRVLNEVREELRQVTLGGIQLDMQCAVAMVNESKPDLIRTGRKAMEAMRTRKMLDTTSAHSSLLDSLAQAQLESDSTTEAHVKRTRHMGELLGRRLHLSDEDLNRLALLCLLHDIGKLGVPLEILNKPNRLTPEEWVVMQSHVYKGYNICSASRELEDIADYVLHHHECWDGSGYPDRLRGEAIPLLSRIIAVVDAYDAMTNDRPYRPAMPTRKAREELRKFAGTQFDPVLVAEYLAMLEEMEPTPESEEASAVSFKPMGLPVVQEVSGEAGSQVSQVQFGTYTLDDEERVIACDETFTMITGYTWEDVKELKLNQFDLVPPEDLPEYRAMLEKLLPKSNDVYLEHRLRRKDGSVIYVFCYGHAHYSVSANAMRSEIVVINMGNTMSAHVLYSAASASRERADSIIDEKLRLDALTSLLNRTTYQSVTQQQLMKPDTWSAMFMLDIDHFKGYNDTHGHAFGDTLLQHFGQALKAALPEDSIACRMGGDEFSFLLSWESSVSRAVIQSEIFSVWRDLQVRLRAFDESVTLSGGAVVCRSEQNTTFLEMYKQADASLYRAKEGGRDRLEINWVA